MLLLQWLYRGPSPSVNPLPSLLGFLQFVGCRNFIVLFSPFVPLSMLRVLSLEKSRRGEDYLRIGCLRALVVSLCTSQGGRSYWPPVASTPHLHTFCHCISCPERQDCAVYRVRDDHSNLAFGHFCPPFFISAPPPSAFS